MSIRKTQVANLTAGLGCMFASASFRSLNVFTVPTETADPRLLFVWSRGLCFDYLTFSLGSFLTTACFNIDSITISTSTSVNPLTVRFRTLSCLASLTYLFLLFSIPAIQWGSPALMFLSVVPIGLSSAYFYLVGVNALISWMPFRRGTAISMSTLGFGSSQVLVSAFFNQAIASVGVQWSFMVASISLFFLALLCGIILRFPSEDDIWKLTSGLSELTARPQKVYETIEDTEIPNCEPVVDERRPWTSLFRLPVFMKFVFLMIFGRTSLCFYPYFFKLGYVLGIPTATVETSFQIMSIANIVFVFSMGLIYDAMTKRLGHSFLRPIIFSVFIMQICLFVILSLLSTQGTKFANLSFLCVALEITMLETHMAFNVIHAGDLFGKDKQMMAFSLAAGLTIGPAGAIFTFIMTVIDKLNSVNGVSTPQTFLPYYCIAVIICLGGSILTFFA